KVNEAKAEAFKLFAKGASVDQVAAAIDRAPRSAWSYLAEFIQKNPSQPLDPWIDLSTCQAVTEAALEVGTAYLKPIFDRPAGRVPYDHIRLVLARFKGNLNN